MDYATLLTESQDGICTITLNRPKAMNALSRETLTEVKQAVSSAIADTNVKVIILTGSGEKAFVAGADISELSKEDARTGRGFAAFGQDVFNTIERATKPVIAAVNGFALGGGCELAMACHMRIASENAKFGQPEVNLGIIPGYGGTQRLPRLVGLGRAMELVLTGDLIDAQEAYRIGLVNKVVAPGEALEIAKQLAGKIIAKSEIAVKYSLQAMEIVPQTGLQEGLNHEAALFGLCCGSSDFKEGTQAFLEKRKPEFKGE